MRLAVARLLDAREFIPVRMSRRPINWTGGCLCEVGYWVFLGVFMGDAADAHLDEMFLSECEWCGAISFEPHDDDCPCVAEDWSEESVSG